MTLPYHVVVRGQNQSSHCCLGLFRRRKRGVKIGRSLPQQAYNKRHHAAVTKYERLLSTLTSSSSSSSASSSSFQRDLYEVGFDICHGPFSICVYNDYIQEKNLPLEALRSPKRPPTSERLSATSDDVILRSLSSPVSAYLIGNTKHFWPIFIRWLKTQRHQQLLRDPVDTYTCENL